MTPLVPAILAVVGLALISVWAYDKHYPMLAPWFCPECRAVFQSRNPITLDRAIRDHKRGHTDARHICGEVGA